MQDDPRVSHQGLCLYRLQVHLRNANEKSALHGMQAGVHDQNDQGTALHLQEGALHGHALLAASGLQTSTRDGSLCETCIVRM